MWGTRCGLALVLVAGMALAGCSTTVAGVAAPARASGSSSAAPASAPSGKPFKDAQGRFTLNPPAKWVIDDSGEQGTAALFLEPRSAATEARGFSANINVLVVPSPVDLSTAVTGARQELTSLDGYASTTDESLVLRDGTPAHLLGGTFVDPGSGLELRNEQLFAVHDGSAIVATGTSLADDWETYEPVLDTALRSLTVDA
ncbi:LpqN/LpqT family lipoprotein [Pseudonocardia sp. CA-142604]|uniref:LpqN/LpqT family lipoprotein n=1 Tax=Pseudonocardia sp. CA-142604 TaxID=3240024 RepID=UPI003D8E4BCE